MALSTYSDLIASVTGHLRRGDLTSSIPDFISMGEARLNRTLRLLQQETTRELSASTTSRFVSLPADFLEVISLSMLVSGQRKEIHPLSADAMNKAIGETGEPDYYRISESIEFERVSDAAYPLYLRMLKRWDIATDGTNWLMQNCPDCYIYSALIAAEPYIKNDSRLMVWRELLTSAITEANALDSRTRADTLMVFDPGMVGAGSFDIVSGQ